MGMYSSNNKSQTFDANCSLDIPSLREGRGRRVVAAVGGDEGEPPVDDGGDGDEQHDDEVVVHGRPVVVRQLRDHS